MPTAQAICQTGWMTTIRPARPADVAILSELARDAYAPYVDLMGTEPAPMRTDYAALVDAHQVWVAELDGVVVGLLVLKIEPDHLLLDNVAVSAEARGTGIGRRLLAFADAYAREHGRTEVRLYTNEAMTENIAYYPRHGYVETHRATDNGYRRVFFTKSLLRNFRLGTFSPSVLVEVATAIGRFAEAGLSVTEVPATSSPQQFTDLFAGELDAALTNPDNVLAYRCVPENPLRRTGDVRILYAVDRGLGLALFTPPGHADLDHVRGGTVAVDVPGSGFAFVTLELLARRGLRAGIDYTVESFGSTPKRALALLAGTCDATVLNAGNDLLAERRGAHRIDSVGTIGPYVGAVLAGTGEALDRDREALRSMVRILREVGTALIRGEHRELALSAAKQRLDLDDDGARRYLETLTDPNNGLVPDGRISPAELATLIDLRNRHRPGDQPLDPDQVLRSGLVDESLI